jgi:uncharacterized protein
MFQNVLLTLLILLAPPALGASDNLADAVRALEAGRHTQAIEILTPLANEGNPLAQYRLGTIYYHGNGVAEDEKQAIYWWKKAATSGHTESMYQLGSAFLYGSQAAKIVPDPDREAAIWYFQAASAGHTEAQYHLGLLFLAGKGVISSQTEAARWMRKAADAGHPEARKALQSIHKRK